MPVQSDDDKNLLGEARELSPALTGVRRKLHANPELSFRETETAVLVTSTLKALGYEVKAGMGGTGVVAEIGAGRTFVIRADMDALPIQESNGCEYASTIPGVMHACGHDGHVACALGAAMLLANNPPQSGKVRFIFQPAEESVNRSGKSGAQLVLEEGLLDDVAGITALHVDTRLPVGKIAVRDGAQMAGGARFGIKIVGAASHAAYPHDGIDAIYLAARVVRELGEILSRRKDSDSPAVITVGGIRSNSYRANVVAGEVQMTGTIRYLSDDVGAFLREELHRVCKTVEPAGASYTLKFHRSIPPTVNDAALTEVVRSVGRELLGDNSVDECGYEMASDDFAFLSARQPGCYFLLGAQASDGLARPTHSPRFDLNEDCLPVGAALLAGVALGFLAGKK